MIGLIALALLCAWIWLAAKAGKWIAAKINAGRSSPLVVAATVAAFLVLPVIDEIVGGFQFRALCKENASDFRLGVKNPEGRTTKVTIDPSNRYVEGTAIPIRHSRIMYHDTSTAEMVVTFDRYAAEGGRLVRSIWMPDKPIILGQSTCSPLRGEAENVALKFYVVD